MKTYFLSLLFFIAIPCLLDGQISPVNSKYYSYQNGLPDRLVFDIFKDSNDMMWVSTPSGLARFDGKQINAFSNIDLPNIAQKIPIKGAGKISEDRFKNLIIQSNYNSDSLEILNINTLEAYGFSLNNTEYIEGEFRDLSQLKNGNIYLLTKSGSNLLIYLWQNHGKFKLVQKIQSVDSSYTPSDRLTVSPDGTTWIFDYTQQKIIKLKDNKELNVFPLDNQNTSDKMDMNFFKSTQLGNLFYSVSNQKKLKLIDSKNDSIQTFNTKEQFNLFWEDNNGNVIISATTLGISNKLFLINKKKEVIDLENIRKIESKITSIYGDDFTKSFHLGSYNGFYVFEFSIEKENINHFLTQELKEGRFGNIMRGFVEDNLNNIYAAEEGSHWYQLNTINHTFDTLQLRDEHGNILENISCGSNFIFDGKYVWGVSCNRENPGRIHRYHPETKKWKVWYLPEDAVFPRFILPRSENEFYVYTLHRIERDGDLFIFNKENGKFTSFESWTGNQPPLENRKINYVLDDQNETHWIATSNGLLKFDLSKKEFKSYFINQYNNDISTLHLDKKGMLWVGTHGLGLFYFDISKEEFHPFNLNNDFKNQPYNKPIPILPNYYISGILPFSKNEYLISTWRGLALINLEKKSSIHYFQKDGLSSDELNRLSIYKDEKNTIYLGGINGFDVFQLEDLQAKKTHPTPRITRFFTYDNDKEQIKNQYQQLDISQTLNIAPSNLFFGFDFMLPNYLESENNTFQTWLEGYEYGYNAPTKTPTIQYNKVPPGYYKLHIKANDSRGNTSVEELVLSICVQEYFYKSWWFLSLAVLSLFGLVIWFFRRRIHKIKEKELEEKERRETQRKFLELELKTLRLQLNPHFMFNALGAIQYYIKENNSRLAVNYLADFAKLMRLFLESSKKRYIELNEELELIQLYVDLEKMRFDNKFEVEYLIDDSINLPLTEIPSLLLQPFIENAINHGLRHKVSKGKLKIELKQDKTKNILHCIIEDDGIGRARATAIKKQSLKKHKSRGTQIVQERLEAFKLSGEMDLEIKTEDANPSAKDCGTRVTVSIPLDN